MAEGMSLRAYAKARGVGLRAIQYQVEQGTIQLVNGKVDPEQADASWGEIRRARMEVQADDAGRRSARAKVAVAMAKLRLTKEEYETVRERYVDRAEAIETGWREADYIITSLQNVPLAYAESFATRLAIDPDVARQILARFIALVLGELGDIRRQAAREAERV